MNTQIISKIIERDRVFGKLCSEAQNSYEQENYFSALACLFVAMEQAVKFIVTDRSPDFEMNNKTQKLKKRKLAITRDNLDRTYISLWEYVQHAKTKNYLSNDLVQFIELVSKFRNNIFHSNLYPTGIEIEGKFYSYSEDNTLRMIYEELSLRVFELTLESLAQ